MLHTAYTVHRTQHFRQRRKPQYWFDCSHDLIESVNFEIMRSKGKEFTIFIGHHKKPLLVRIKKIKHLSRSRYGRRVQLELSHTTSDEHEFTITVIYNRDNYTMVIKPMPKSLLK